MFFLFLNKNIYIYIKIKTIWLLDSINSSISINKYRDDKLGGLLN